MAQTKRQHKQTWILTASLGTENPQLDFWITLAQQAEQAKLHSLIILDSLVEPSVYISAVGDQTESIGLSVGYTTQGEHPYLQSRKFASLDEFTKGRVGWANTPELKYSDEYLEVFAQLHLSSWRDDALVKNKATGEWIDTKRLRQIDFEGPTYQVPGPGLTKPTPQRFPVIFSLDTTTDAARRHAAKYAEVIVVYGDKEQVKKTVDEIKQLAADDYGRDANSIKFLAQVFVVVGPTSERLARKKFNEGAAPAKGFTPVFGTAQTVADELQSWVDLSGVDGFNFHGHNVPDIASLLAPELQGRGVAQVEYTTPGGSLRENLTGAQGDTYLAQDHPFFNYRWFNNQSKEEFEQVLEIAKAKVAINATGYGY